MSQLKVHEIVPPSSGEVVEILKFRFLEKLLGGVTYRKDWVSGETYNEKDVVIYDDLIYRANVNHTAGETFTLAYWDLLDVSISVAGVTPGEYTKVTVNELGRVVSGAPLTSSDLPAVPAEKITGVVDPDNLGIGTPSNDLFLRGDGVWASPTALIGTVTETQIATAGQTLITLADYTYIPGSNSIAVYLNGIRLESDVDYTESSNTTLTMVEALSSGDKVVVVRSENYTNLVDPTIRAQLAASDGASLVGYQSDGAGAVARTAQDKLRDVVSVKDFGVLGNGTDETVKIQAALNAGLGPVTFPPGIYGVTSEIVIPDGSGIIGAGAHWKRRTGYAYDPTKQTVFKYIGAGGTNTCVLRFSNTAVGVQGSDFSGAETNDLINVTARDFHIDCNGLAEIGLYIYRAGNQATIGNVTAEKAKKFNHVHLGCFAAEFGTFGAYESEEHGVACGWDLYGWTGGEYTHFAFRARYLTANNGTAGTYVAGSGTDLDGSGGKFSVGRGSEVFITSEANDGRACILGQPTVGGAAAGTTDYILEYVEGNGDGPYIDYRTGSDGIRIGQGFIHPGNGTTLLPQNIKIEGKSSGGVVTADSGPNDQEEWLVLYRMFGDLLGVGPTIDSNTYKYRMVECCRYFTFANKRPGAFTFNLSLEGSTTPGTQSYTTRTGFCTRVGNLVHVTGRITLSALDATTSGQIRITGLPYRIANQSGYFGAVAIGPWNALSTPAIRLDGTLSGNTTYINMQIMTAASTGNLTGLARTDLSATSMIQFSATYITDES